MPATPALPDGAPIWIDLGTPDLEATVAFYTGLFGWTYTSFGPEFGDYGQFSKSGQAIAGVGPLALPGQPAVWGTYLKSFDVAATAVAAAEHGGTVAYGPDEVPGQGRFVTVIDPSGAAVGFWEPMAHTGYGLYGEHGTAAWHELHTRDYEAAVDFYAAVAGWDVHTMSDTEDFRYATFGAGDDALAGIFDATHDLPDGVPSFWTVYLGSDDPDATAKLATQLGGTVLEPPIDTPYGRMATIADPHGTQFKIISI
ncbi:VOC family protein [Antribacter sp. KLBMP9083]|uniref:VOC family protein n=1 Tax=Antribacter soli TaxID=2910976 RepID=A0AA41QEE1_9MICO|nr:VOC family protein [Antribacter soli]MCF4120597.1 VOC family protein [Antribacter soli]